MTEVVLYLQTVPGDRCFIEGQLIEKLKELLKWNKQQFNSNEVMLLFNSHIQSTPPPRVSVIFKYQSCNLRIIVDRDLSSLTRGFPYSYLCICTSMGS